MTEALVVEKVETPEEKIERLEAENSKLREQNEILEEAHTHLINQNEELSKKSYFDELTGLMSRRALDEEMARRGPYIFKKSNNPERRSDDGEEKENIILVIFDIDHFKDVNDKRGHKAGDLVLQRVAQTVRQHVRRTDMVARWGGEEMVVAFDGAKPEGAEFKANFIREKVAALKFEEFPDLRVTISAGLANSTDFSEMESFFKAADSALYQSKRNGRNRVTAYSQAEK